MSDKLLNLVSYINEKNWKYDVRILHNELDGYDYTLNCISFYDDEAAEYGQDFQFTGVVELLADFADYEVQSYVRQEGPYGVTDEDDKIRRHEVEITVKE